MQILTQLIKVNHTKYKEWLEFDDGSVLYLDLVLKSCVSYKIKMASPLKISGKMNILTIIKRMIITLYWHKFIFISQIDFLK